MASDRPPSQKASLVFFRTQSSTALRARRGVAQGPAEGRRTFSDGSDDIGEYGGYPLVIGDYTMIIP